MVSFLPALPLFAELEVGYHLYWHIGQYTVHGQVLISSWIAIGILLILLGSSTRQMQRVPSGLQNFGEYVLEFVQGIAKSSIHGEEYRTWVPYIGTVFLFILVSNWMGNIFPWKLIHLPSGELASPTNDINTTAGLALLTSLTYFYAGFRKRGLGYFKKYIEPVPLMLPLNILEDLAKPLSLSFRLFGNILAEELVIGVFVLLVPIFLPLPFMILFLFTGAIQAVIFATLTASYVGEALEGHGGGEEHHD